MSSINSEHFVQAIKSLLDETFDNVRGHYLDGGTSMFETLADISAEEASIPVGGKCATLAAQVKHTAFFLEVVEKSVRDPNFPQADWGEIWRTVGEVTAAQWQAIQQELRDNYNNILKLIEDTPEWSHPAQIGGAIGVVAHTAYHLGEIRQALCTIRS